MYQLMQRLGPPLFEKKSIVHTFLFSFHNSDVFGLTILVRMLGTTAYYYNTF
jgi:hypothetical protein